jgi:hypothetical protein
VNASAYAPLRRHQKAWLWRRFLMEFLVSKNGAVFILGSFLSALTAFMLAFGALWLVDKYEGAPIAQGSAQEKALASYLLIVGADSDLYQDNMHKNPGQNEFWIGSNYLKPQLAVEMPPSFASARAAAQSLKIWQDKNAKGEPIDLTEKGLTQTSVEISEEVNRSWRDHQTKIKAGLKFSNCPYWEGLRQASGWLAKPADRSACSLVQTTDRFVTASISFFFILMGSFIAQLINGKDLGGALDRIPKFTPWLEASGERHLTRLEAHKLRWASRGFKKSTKKSSARL